MLNKVYSSVFKITSLIATPYLSLIFRVRRWNSHEALATTTSLDASRINAKQEKRKRNRENMQRNANFCVSESPQKAFCIHLSYTSAVQYRKC